MLKQAKKVVIGVGALAALALGGGALAQAGSHPAQHASVSNPAVEKVAATDTDTTQSGNQSTPDASGSSSETPGTETADSGSSESNSSNESSGSENTNDGPGGHADAPGASVDHQFNGQE